MKEGTIGDAPASEAYAYLNVLKTSDSSFGAIFNEQVSSEVGTDWSGGSIEVSITAEMVGETLQIGFKNVTTEWAASGVVYDNLSFSAVPEPSSLGLLGLVGLAVIGRRRRN